MVMNKLLIATHNIGKFNLFKDYLAHTAHDLLSLDDCGITYDVPETGSTFEENARIKAEAYMKLTGLPTLSDDGGIEIDALNGEPGVYSSRYAGPDATDKQKVLFLLEKMQHVPQSERTGRFVVVLALALPGQEIVTFKGVMEGTISFEPRGILRKGLPYRQIFIPSEFEYTLDELDDMGVKGYISHRKKALESVINYLQSQLSS